LATGHIHRLGGDHRSHRGDLVGGCGGCVYDATAPAFCALLGAFRRVAAGCLAAETRDVAGTDRPPPRPRVGDRFRARLTSMNLRREFDRARCAPRCGGCRRPGLRCSHARRPTLRHQPSRRGSLTESTSLPIADDLMAKPPILVVGVDGHQSIRTDRSPVIRRAPQQYPHSRSPCPGPASRNPKNRG